MTDDGARVTFQTTERLTAADTDNEADVYQRAGGVTTLISAGPGGNGASSAHWAGSSKDGSVVFVRTADPLTPQDTDGGEVDIYRWEGGSIELATGPEPGASGPSSTMEGQFFIVTGSKLLFQTPQGLVPGDTDGLQDVYEFSGGHVHLLSQPAPGGTDDGSTSLVGNFSAGGEMDGASGDGGYVALFSTAHLVGADNDNLPDLYLRHNGITSLITAPEPGAGGTAENFQFEGMSRNGEHVFFTTFEKLIASDTDAGSSSLYESYPGGLRLVALPEPGAPDQNTSDGALLGVSDDGAHVFFGSDADLIPGAPATDFKIYERFNGRTQLVSAADPGGADQTTRGVVGIASSNGLHYLWTTGDRLVAGDTDANHDVYERFAGATRLLSVSEQPGIGSQFAAELGGISNDGAAAFFTTAGSLTSGDTDTKNDVYERSGGRTTLISRPGVGAQGPVQGASFESVSGDGTHVLFTTTERLVADDTDDQADFYESTPSGVTLITTPSASPSGPPQDEPDGSGTPDGVAGDLDASFGHQGRLTRNLPGASDVAIDAQGRLIVAPQSDRDDDPEDGDLSVIRLLPDGALDTSFGVGGVASVQTLPMQPGGEHLEIDSQGRIVVLGTGAMARFDGDGHLDNSFGDSGVVQVSNGYNNTDFAIQPDDSIVVPSRGMEAFHFTRYKDTGAIDASFGNGGVATVPGEPSGRQFQYTVAASDAAVMPDGRIVGAGSQQNAMSDASHGVVTRVTPDGQPDPSFNSDVTPGYRTTSPSPQDTSGFSSVGVQPDGAIVTVGGGYFNTEFLVARFSPSGQLDPDFGSGGFVSVRPNGQEIGNPRSGDTGAAAVALQPDGRIVVFGSSGRRYVQNDRAFVVARLLPGGQTDDSFGVAGMSSVAFDDPCAPVDAYASSMALDGHGGIVLTGGAWIGPPRYWRMALARVQRTGATAGSDGKTCKAPAGPPQGGTAAAVAASPAVDVQRVITPKKWRKLIHPGVRVLAGCDTQCKVDVTVTVTQKVADAAGFPSTVVARGSAQVAAGQHEWIHAIAPRKIRDALNDYGGGGRLHVAVTAS